MRNTIKQRKLFDTGAGLLVMVSGGSDSTALMYLMAHLRDEFPDEVGALAALHVNHQLRGKDSDDDAEFVRKLAATLSIPLFVCEIDIGAEAKRSGENIEAVARRERYIAAREALASMCEHEGVAPDSARILTAHSANDRVESFYMRSIVGTGPGGFRGMCALSGDVARPLIDCTRDQLRDYIGSLDFAVRDDAGELWREDATNEHTDRFRAYVRHNIVPAALKWNPSLLTTLPRTMDLIAAEDDLLTLLGDGVVSEVLEDPNANFCLLPPEFATHPRPLQRRAVLKLLEQLLGEDVRIETATVEAVLDAYEDGAPKSGYVCNIQGDLVVSANKKGVRIEPMYDFRKRRNKF